MSKQTLILIPIGPHEWAVEYPPERRAQQPATRQPKSKRKARKRYGIADSVAGFRSGKRYVTVKAAEQAAATHTRRTSWEHHATSWRE